MPAHAPLVGLDPPLVVVGVDGVEVEPGFEVVLPGWEVVPMVVLGEPPWPMLLRMLSHLEVGKL